MQHVEHEEGLRIHFVRLIDVRIKLILDAIGQDRKPGRRDREITIELRRVHLIQVGSRPFAFDQDNDLLIFGDCVIDFFSLLDADVRREFGDDFQGVKHVVAQRTDEGHDKCVLGGLFRLRVLHLFGNPGGDVFHPVNQIHHFTCFLFRVVVTYQPAFDVCLCAMPEKGRGWRTDRLPCVLNEAIFHEVNL